jgi:stage II sporulation protein E
MFTTLDICCINMHSGRGRVIKNGGASAFIIHGRNTEEIKSSSLPVGVLSKAEPEITGFEVEGGDMIILVTDGITDCIENSSEFLKDILNSGKRTASDICSEMVNRAKEMQNGKCRDDMLAVGMKIYEKV